MYNKTVSTQDNSSFFITTAAHKANQQQDLIIRKATTEEQIKQCYDIRIEIFVHEQKCSLEGEIDSYDPLSHHWLALLPTAETVVGTIRIYIAQGTQVGKIGRVAVKSTARGLRIGVRLMNECERYEDKMGFYTKLGYVLDEAAVSTSIPALSSLPHCDCASIPPALRLRFHSSCVIYPTGRHTFQAAEIAALQKVRVSAQALNMFAEKMIVDLKAIAGNYQAVTMKESAGKS
ncbi:acyl-CoA N-acyltransferase [Jimgerdemannia flammicorona]|uniref:Acyl-CoA N-acyltransferase n=1 Tax=Jimgerdemannia flammicorona TaxID=994334 RepID=A0A433QDH2_9FUNG|nr:acyl-CoA N-acyltransferase [Jimgerdemannia flammicorona]